MKRLKSIDIFRGICMVYMITGHLTRWWVQSQFIPPLNFFYLFVEPFGASGFLFISGLSIALSFDRKYKQTKLADPFTYKRVKHEYFFKAAIIMAIALLYNLILGLATGDIAIIWSWFILLTVAISLFFAFPLLHLSNVWRALVGIGVIAINQYFLPLVLPSQGQSNFFGILYYVFYSGDALTPILSFFPFFLFGTIIGDLVYKHILSKSAEENKKAKRNFFIILFSAGAILAVSGGFLYFPNFILRESLSWIINSLGLEICLFSFLLFIEEYDLIKIEGRFKFFFYYSYYSLMIFLGHNILALLFWHRLNYYNVWPFVIIAFVGITYVLKYLYETKPDLLSVKYYIGTLSSVLAKFVEEKRGVFKVVEPSSSSDINL
ncbi:MAG: heparan-alpha-glucosaminide N-acetyltransferase domain-containing protein [Candidatus Lokiarchaeota archaeon]